MQNYDKIISSKPTTGLSKGAKQGLIVFAVLFVIALVLFVFQIFFRPTENLFKVPSPSPEVATRMDSATNAFPFVRGDSIAVVHVEGVIQDENANYNHAWLLDTIDSLTYDKNNAAILLFINSPGGGVYQSDEVYLALEEYKEKSGKAVWAYFGPLAASGGYYIGCAADVIYANRNTLTGSIGVISSSSFDLTKLMDTYGISMTTITAGRNKNMMNINSPMTVEHRAIMQSIADEAYNQFTKIVSDARKMDIEKVWSLADGRIYTALQAQENGLIDYVSSLEDAIIDMEVNVFEGESMNIWHYTYEEEKTLTNYLLDFSSSIKALFNSKEAMALDSIQSSLGLPSNMEYPAYYYHQ